MKILIGNTHVPFIRGGAEKLCQELKDALELAGHRVDLIAFPFKWYPPQKIPEHILATRLIDITESCGEKIDLFIGIKFPVYYIKHPNKVLWIAHQHRQAYELWKTPYGDMHLHPEGEHIRQIIMNADNEFLKEAKKIYTISQNVSNRLKKYNNIHSIPLYPPLNNCDSFYCEDSGDYVFYPSRIGSIKRQDLAIESLRYTRSKIKLIISGTYENLKFMEKLKEKIKSYRLEDRVLFTGPVSEEEKLKLYANSLGVIFIPYDEDYGYVTLEAMYSRKPLITCTDSGGPLEFIEDSITGFIVDPEPETIAEILDKLYLDKTNSNKMGNRAYEKILSMNISWQRVLEELLK